MCMLGTKLAALLCQICSPTKCILKHNPGEPSRHGDNLFHEHTHVSEDNLNAYKGKEKGGSMQGECPHCVCHRYSVTEGDLTQFAAQRGRMDLLLEASIISAVSLDWFFIRRGEKCPLREGASKRASHESKAQWETFREGRRWERCHVEGWWEYDRVTTI